MPIRIKKGLVFAPEVDYDDTPPPPAYLKPMEAGPTLNSPKGAKVLTAEQMAELKHQFMEFSETLEKLPKTSLKTPKELGWPGAYTMLGLKEILDHKPSKLVPLKDGLAITFEIDKDYDEHTYHAVAKCYGHTGHAVVPVEAIQASKSVKDALHSLVMEAAMAAIGQAVEAAVSTYVDAYLSG